MTLPWHDFRFAARTLVKNPGFSLVAILTLALGIGANTSIFSVVDAVLLEPLPFAEPERLAIFDEANPSQGSESGIGVSYATFLAWRDQGRAFESIAAYQGARVTFVGAEEPMRVAVAYVTADLFRVLRVTPTHGRAFIAEDDRPESAAVAVVSKGFADRWLSGAEKAVGRSIMLDGSERVVVGVVPDAQSMPSDETVAWMPLGRSADRPSMRNRAVHLVNVIARLRDDTTLEGARVEIAAISARLDDENPAADPGHMPIVLALHDVVVGPVRPALLVLVGAVGFVLLIACVNVANLLIARAAGREKELAIRAALGASRARVAKQLLTESLLIASLGAWVGLALAALGNGLLVAQFAATVPRARNIAIDGPVLAFTMGLALLTAVLFGLAPALRSSRVDLNTSLKDGGRKASTTRSKFGLRGALVVGEVALSLVLLIGAGLMLKSFWRVLHVDPGFRSDHLMTAAVSLPPVPYQEGTRATDFYNALPARLAAIPGVEAVSAVSALPISGGDGRGTVTFEGGSIAAGQKPEASFRRVLPSYFRVMNVPLVEGREFDERDLAVEKVVIVNESFARRFWPAGEVIGKRIKVGPPENEPWLTIVGVVGDVRNVGLDADPSLATYEPLAQRPRLSMNLVLRTNVDPTSVMPAVRASLRAAEKGMLIGEVSTLEQRLARSVSPRRLNLVLLSLFSATALLLSVVGLYGVMSHLLAQRIREIGIRMALGARAIDVMRQVSGEGLVLIGWGVSVGTLGALALTRSVSTLLFGVSPTDPAVFVSVGALLSLVAFVACCIPAHRATRLDPVAALRQD